MLSKKQNPLVTEPLPAPEITVEVEAPLVVTPEPRFVMSFQQFCQERGLSVSLVGAMKHFVRGDLRDRTAAEWQELYARMETV